MLDVVIWRLQQIAEAATISALDEALPPPTD
jgi:hypothetical protein